MTVTKVTVESALKDLCQNLAGTFVGNAMLNYGEAVESIVEGSAGNYVSKDGQTYCAVNDTYPLVLFLVRESASVEAAPAVTYAGTDYNSKAIANQYFGLPERNFETYFFSIDFSVTERISCEVAC